ncbi:MAG TPA: PadR family transcriptional regulator [Gammaproteobacteria bacterium]|nr:PadR family transcriptional regulator [Gammaproteobacteria bacterium]
MDVKTLCLGALMEGDASGYDIKKYFECTFRHFFVAGFGSIYPALAELTRTGQVTCKTIPQDGKPDRKVYALTPQGKDNFIAALSTCEPTHKVRSQFLVMMFFARYLPAERQDEILQQRLAELQESITAINNFEQELHQQNQPLPFCAGFGKAVTTAARDYIHQYQNQSDNNN